MDIVIRPFAPVDLDALADAFAPAPYGKQRAQYERYLAEHQAGERVTLVARASAGAVIGYVNLLWRSAYKPFIDAGVPEINDLNVLVPWRGRGVGTSLIAAAEAVARAAGRPLIGIGVGLTPDYGVARQLYPSLGYVLDERGPQATAYGDVQYLTKVLVPNVPVS